MNYEQDFIDQIQRKIDKHQKCYRFTIFNRTFTIVIVNRKKQAEYYRNHPVFVVSTDGDHQ